MEMLKVSKHSQDIRTLVGINVRFVVACAVGKMNQKRRARMRMAFEGAQKLQELCHKIVGNEGKSNSLWSRSDILC